MGRQNFLVEGVSATGKTSVGEELARRGHHVVHGDRELAYQGNPASGAPTQGAFHEHHLWDVDRVRALVADQGAPATFFCGGCRNFPAFVDLFDAVFVLHVDPATLHQRLERRPAGEWGAYPAERDLIVRLHRSGKDVPDGHRRRRHDAPGARGRRDPPGRRRAPQQDRPGHGHPERGLTRWRTSSRRSTAPSPAPARPAGRRRPR